MAASPLTPFLLDPSLIALTRLAVAHALGGPSEGRRYNRGLAMRALAFYIEVLNPDIVEEREVLALMHTYRAALDGEAHIYFEMSKFETYLDARMALDILHLLPLPSAPIPIIASISSNQEPVNLFTAASGEELPPPPLLVPSQAHHPSAYSSSYRDGFIRLDDLRAQVHFTFECSRFATTPVGGPGGDIRSLEIHWLSGNWNGRLLVKLASLLPQLEELAVHYGTTNDGQEDVTQDVITTIYSILSPLRRLTRLKLLKLSCTPPLPFQPTFGRDAHLPFSRLESLSLHEFYWYLEPISRGLGPCLKTLKVGHAPNLPSDRMSEFLFRLSSLTTLHSAVTLKVEHIEALVQGIPGLEILDLTQVEEVDPVFVEKAVPLLSSLSNLRELTLSFPISAPELDAVILSRSPLEIISLTINLHPDIEDQVVRLLRSKSETLAYVVLQFSDGGMEDDEEFAALAASDPIVEALADCTNLSNILIDFEDDVNLSSSTVDRLLRQCPRLKITESLQTLVMGNELYEREYKERLEQELAMEEEW